MGTKIITDSLSDITNDVAQLYDLEVIPIEIALDGAYKSVKDVEVTQSIQWIEKNKKRPMFKGISADRYEKIFKKYTDQGMEIVCISAGSKSISNYDSACHVSTRFPDNSIRIIDSKQLSSCVGIMAIKAAEMAQQGESSKAIVMQIERTMDKCKQYGLTDSVNFLQYSGFYPKILAVGSNLINAKFMFNMKKDRNFGIEIVGYSMGKAVTAFCINVFKNLRSIDPKRVVLMRSPSDEDYFSEIHKYVIALNYFDNVIVCSAGHFTTSIVGYNAFGVSYQLK